MQLILGADHGGLRMKEDLKVYLESAGFTLADHGVFTDEPADYPLIAESVAKQVIAGNNDYGILICRSGEGMEMAANKIEGIRAALVWKAEVARETRQHNNANILVLPADHITFEEARIITQIFIDTPFSGAARHARRIEELTALDGTKE